MKPRVFNNPAHKQCSEILTDAQWQEFIRTITTMTAKRINKKQLEALLKEAGLKKTGRANCTTAKPFWDKSRGDTSFI